MTDYAVMGKLDEIRHLMEDKVRDRWLTLQEVCAYSKLSESTVRRSIKAKQLKVSRQTGRLLVKVSNVDRWLNG